MPETPMAEFHIIVRGQCWLRLPGERTPIALRGGDVVVFMTGGPHALLDNPKGRAFPPEVVLRGQAADHFGPVTFGGGGSSVTLLCGYFRFDRDSRHPLIAALPPLIHIREGAGDASASVRNLVALMTQETRAAQPGAEAIINRLCEMLFVHIVRAYLEQSPGVAGILAALADSQICAALNEVHHSPERPWTLAALASRLGMSRSAFAARFHELVGQTPMQYLTNWRMETARRLLLERRLSIAAVAEHVGYGSEAAFGKAFKRIVGVGPGGYRRHAVQRTNSPSEAIPERRIASRRLRSCRSDWLLDDRT
jgi:AraC-like DNA-binding protein